MSHIILEMFLRHTDTKKVNWSKNGSSSLFISIPSHTTKCMSKA